jgi:hypothetical protein
MEPINKKYRKTFLNKLLDRLRHWRLPMNALVAPLPLFNLA